MLSYAMLYNKHNVVLCLSYVVEHIMFVMLYNMLFLLYTMFCCVISRYFMLRYITCYVMFLM